MPVAIKLKTPGVAGVTQRQVIDLTVDFADAASLPPLIKFEDKLWDRVGAAPSVNYKRWIPPTFVDIDDKVLEV